MTRHVKAISVTGDRAFVGITHLQGKLCVFYHGTTAQIGERIVHHAKVHVTSPPTDRLNKGKPSVR